MDTFLYHQFAEIDRNHWWFRARRSIVRHLLRRRLTPGKTRRILDLGCGTGGMLSMLEEFGPVCGMDLSPEAVRYAQESLGGRVEVVQGAVPEDLPRSGSWDMVTAFDVIEHIDDDPGALRGIYETIAPGGMFVCTVPALQLLWGPHDDLNFHRRRYTRAQLRQRLQDAGFVIEKLSYYNFLLFPIIAFVRVGRRIIHRTPGPPRSDFTMPPKLANELLTRLFEAESFALDHFDLPIGVSLVALCRKPSSQ